MSATASLEPEQDETTPTSEVATGIGLGPSIRDGRLAVPRRGENVQHTSSLALAAFSLSLAFRLDDGLHRVAWQRAPVALLAAGARACAHEVVIEELGDVFLECDLHDAAMIGNPRRAEAVRGG